MSTPVNRLRGGTSVRQSSDTDQTGESRRPLSHLLVSDPYEFFKDACTSRLGVVSGTRNVDDIL